MRRQEADQGDDQGDNEVGVRNTPEHRRPREPQEERIHIIGERRLSAVGSHRAKRSTISAEPNTMAIPTIISPARE